MLTYLFTAYFEDGLTINQNAENKSARFENKSCFSDVLDEINKGNRLVRFELRKEENVVSVNLTNGEISILCPSGRFVASAPKENLSNFRPIYFFSVTMGFTMVSANGGEVTGYKVGWQANGERGENVETILEVY